MDQNSFKIDENNEDFQEIIKEANKVLLILPHVPLIEIIKDISNLPKEVRLSRTYLENYFHKNDLENGFNENNFKIDNIRSIFPDVSREKIEADLKDIEKPNKVLHVVKRYLCEKTSVTASLKRTSDDENEEKANAKKLKVCSDNINCEISTIDNTYYSDSENNSKNISVLSALTDVLPNKSMVDLIVICNKYGYKCHDKISIGELNTLLEQILCEKQTSVFEGQQPSTSSCRFNEASTSGQQSSNCQASQETISTCANDLTETYDFKEEDFLTQIDRTSSPVPNQEENTSSLPVPNQHETKQVETKEENSTSLKPDQVEPNSNRSTIIINKNNLLGESSSSTKNENKKEETITNELRNETIDLTAESQVAPTATIDLSYDSDNDSVYGECDINKLKTLYEDDSLEADDSLEEPLTKTQKNLDNFINELVGTLNMPLVENKSNGAIPKVLNKKIVAEAYGELQNAYKDAALSETTCRVWVPHFKDRDSNIEDAELKALLDEEDKAQNSSTAKTNKPPQKYTNVGSNISKNATTNKYGLNNPVGKPQPAIKTKIENPIQRSSLQTITNNVKIIKVNDHNLLQTKSDKEKSIIQKNVLPKISNIDKTDDDNIVTKINKPTQKYTPTTRLSIANQDKLKPVTKDINVDKNVSKNPTTKDHDVNNPVGKSRSLIKTKIENPVQRNSLGTSTNSVNIKKVKNNNLIQTKSDKGKSVKQKNVLLKSSNINKTDDDNLGTKINKQDKLNPVTKDINVDRNVSKNPTTKNHNVNDPVGIPQPLIKIKIENPLQRNPLGMSTNSVNIKKVKDKNIVQTKSDKGKSVKHKNVLPNSSNVEKTATRITKTVSANNIDDNNLPRKNQETKPTNNVNSVLTDSKNVPQNDNHATKKTIVENQYNGRPFVNGIDLTKPGPSNINNAVAHPPKANPNMDKIKIKVMQMFPDICPDYLERCLQVHAVQNIEQIIDILLGVDYPKREIKRERTPPRELDFDEEVALLEELFPDCDPTYLHTKCEEFVRFNNREALQEFINRSLEKKDYPTKTEYLRKLKLSAQEKKYTTEFSVENFLEVIPDPVEYFNKPGRSSYVHLKMDPEFDKYYGYVKQFFRNHFVNLYVADINTAILKGKTFTETAEILEKVNSKMKMKRKPCPLPSCSNIPVLQELAYIKHKKEILDYMEKKKKAAEQMRLLAKQNGLLKTCECCYDEEIMPEDIITCDNQHEFCKTCVKKSAEVLIGDGKTNFPCLATCDQEFSLKVLQIVLPPKLFSKLAIKKQLEEIKSAGIEDLTSCPFCDFATILPPTEKVFRCLNEECMKESCRECKEPSHIPLRCNEVEKDEDIKKRKYIEDKMTEALLRTCYQCGLKFVKEGGCNKMTCSCGAKMCYLCNKPVTDYKHFNGQGGDQHHLCPLFSDTVKLHEEAVKAGAVKAKEELGIRNSDLKVDPTADLEKHFADVKRRNPHNDVQIQNGHPVAPIRQLIPNNVQRPLPQGAFHNVAQNAAGILHQQRRIIQNLREALQQGPP